jgi:hypothetical protein
MTLLATDARIVYSANSAVLYSSPLHSLSSSGSRLESLDQCARGWWNFTDFTYIDHLAPQLWFSNNVTDLVFARMYVNAPENLYSSSLVDGGVRIPTPVVPASVTSANNSALTPSIIQWPPSRDATIYAVDYATTGGSSSPIRVETANMSFALPAFDPSLSYTVNITAINRYVFADTVLTLGVPSRPYGIYANASLTYISVVTLSWMDDSFVRSSSYIVYVSYNNATAVTFTSFSNTYVLPTELSTRGATLKITIRAISIQGAMISAPSIEFVYVVPRAAGTVQSASNALDNAGNVTWPAVPLATLYSIDYTDVYVAASSPTNTTTTNNTFFIIPSFDPSHSYTLNISGIKNGVLSPYPLTVQIPSQPTGVSVYASPSYTSVVLVSWNASIGASMYRVSVVYNTSSTATSVYMTAATNYILPTDVATRGTNVRVRVQAISTQGGLFSKSTNETSYDIPRAPDVVIGAINTRSTANNVTWPPSAYATLYSVNYSDDTSSSSPVTLTAQSPLSSILVPSFDPSHSYTLNISSVNVDVFSFSPLSVQIPSMPTAVGVATSHSYASVVTVTWTRSIGDAVSSYLVYVTYNSTTPATSYTISSADTGATASYVLPDTVATRGTNLTVNVQAVSTQGGLFSQATPNVLYAIPPIPTTPANIASASNSPSLLANNVTWPDVPLATNYSISYADYNTPSSLVVTQAPSTSFSIPTFDPSHSYILNISAINDFVYSLSPLTVQVPSRPAGVGVTTEASYASTVTVSWTLSTGASVSLYNLYVIYNNAAAPGVLYTTAAASYVLPSDVATRGTNIKVRVQAISTQGGLFSQSTDEISYDIPLAPTTPSNVASATNTRTLASTILWPSAAYATKYSVDYNEYTPSALSASQTLLQSPAASFPVPTYDPLRSYVVNITSMDDYVFSPAPLTVHIPSQPTGLGVVFTSTPSGVVNVTWTLSTGTQFTPVLSYALNVTYNSVGVRAVYTVNATTNTYVLPSSLAVRGTTVQLLVQATSTKGGLFSAATNTLVYAIPPTPTTPASVTSATNTIATPNRITWSPTAYATGYTVAYSDYTPTVLSLGHNGVYSVNQFFVVSPFDPTHSYTVSITATDEFVPSSQTLTVHIPATPVALGVTFYNDTGITTVAWTASTGTQFVPVASYILTVTYNIDSPTIITYTTASTVTTYDLPLSLTPRDTVLSVHVLATSVQGGLFSQATTELFYSVPSLPQPPSVPLWRLNFASTSGAATITSYNATKPSVQFILHTGSGVATASFPTDANFGGQYVFERNSPSIGNNSAIFEIGAPLPASYSKSFWLYQFTTTASNCIIAQNNFHYSCDSGNGMRMAHGGYEAVDGRPPVTNVWVHFAHTYNATRQTMSMYINGVLKNIRQGVPFLTNSPPTTVVGAFSTATDIYGLDGRVFAPALWDVELTAAQVAYITANNM